MPKREAPPPHLVFFDTSTLFHQDKGFVVDPRVDAFLTNHCQRFSLNIRVPEVVRGELLYQQTSQALAHLTKANTAIEALSKVTDKTYSHRVTEGRVRREVERRFQRWIDKWKASVVKTPVDHIDWESVIERAVWRHPPFTSDDGKEKGFRDCLIMESVIYCATNHGTSDPLAFICKDAALRESTAERLGSDARFSCYERIADFQSYLDLTLEDLEDRFIKAILKRAESKFFSPSDETCLAFRVNLSKTLRERYAADFSDPEKNHKRGALAGLLSDSTAPAWTSAHHGKFWVGAPEFLKKTDGNFYYWRSELEYAEPFKRSDETQNLLAKIMDPERVHVLRFAIQWRAKVTADGRFRSLEYVEDSLMESEFRAPTDEEKSKWRLNYES